MAKECEAFQQFGFATLIGVSKPMAEKFLVCTLRNSALESVDTHMHHVGMELTSKPTIPLHAGLGEGIRISRGRTVAVVIFRQ